MKRPEPPSLRETIRGLTGQLEAAGVESPRVEAERLLAHVLEVDRARLALEADEPLPAGAAAEVARLVARRASGEPLQHLEGTVAFRDLVLRADSRALVPRPETEQLVDLVVSRLRRTGGGPATGSGVRVVRRPTAGSSAVRSDAWAVDRALDVGTGSGAIALSLLVEGIARRAVGVDISEAALAQARENRARAGIPPSAFELRRTSHDPFDALASEERFDLLVSNPPYVRDAEIDDLPAEVRDHEPREALAGGPDGLDLVRAIAADAPTHLWRGALLALEIGADQGPSAIAVLEADPAWRDVRLHRDLAGRERFVTARRG